MFKFKQSYHFSRSILNWLFTLLYTWFNKSQFYAWGKHSILEKSAKLIAPYLIDVGSHVIISEHAWLNAKDDRGDFRPTLKIGSGTSIGRFVHINCWQDVTIEENVLIADRVFISDADHKYDDLSIPIKNQGDYFKGAVRLKAGCWIGIGAVILPGVTIGKNAIVGANSVVRKNVPDFAVVSGNPAIIIRYNNNKN
jgi:acetyltransferase-like isoleucine patch superfamily enzyme